MRARHRPGLRLRGGYWHIDKVIRGRRICESTGCRHDQREEAKAHYDRRVAEVRSSLTVGTRPNLTWRDAATRYLTDYQAKKSIVRDALALRDLDPFIGDLPLNHVHWDSLAGYRASRAHLAEGTIVRNLSVVRRILTLAARLWRHPNGMTWLETAPLLPLGKVRYTRQPYPLTWEEQRLLFEQLAPHLAQLALFMVNTGVRDQEACGLRWEWERKVPGAGSVFVLPGHVTKNGEARVIVLNRAAQSVVESLRGTHPDYVFSYEGRRISRTQSTGWKAARRRAAARYREELGRDSPAGFRHVRVHDLRHTYGRRLRAAGVGLEDRADLLGHKTERITTHYSVAEIAKLKRAADRIADSRKSHAITVLQLV